MLRLEGEAAAGLAKVFAWDWEVETGVRVFPTLPAADGQRRHWLSIIPSGPGMGDLINEAVLTSIYRANHNITVSTPYFVPSQSVLDALCQAARSEEHTSELQSRPHLVCRLLLEKKNT